MTDIKGWWIPRSNTVYIDATFITPKEFTEVFIILYLYPIKNIKVPGAYILINNKKETSYNIIFNNLYNILTNIVYLPTCE